MPTVGINVILMNKEGRGTDMFKEIGDEKAFDEILNQIIENIQNGCLK